MKTAWSNLLRLWAFPVRSWADLCPEWIFIRRPTVTSEDCTQAELHSYPLCFSWVTRVTTMLILRPLEERRLPVTCAPKYYTFGPALLFAKLLKPQVLCPSIKVAEESYQMEDRSWWKAGAWKGTFWWILFMAFSAVQFHLTEAGNNLRDKDLLPAVLATWRQHWKYNSKGKGSS